jgi:SecD/SecF fusion protein
MTNKKKIRKSRLAWLGVIIAAIAVLVVTTYGAISSHLNLGLDLKGGFEILYQVTPLDGDSSVDMTAVVNSISKRVNVLGVSEPSITVEGNDRIRVQLAGVADQDAAREMIGTTANLTFRDIDDNLLADSSILTEGGASLGYDSNGLPIVSLKIADQTKFAEITSSISQKTSGENMMVIWLDYSDGDSYKTEAAKKAQGEEPKYISAASVSSQITGDCQISGNFTEEEAKTLANLINSGSLPVKMTELSSNVVSAQFGMDALSKTGIAGLIGVIGVMLYMIIKYKMPGVISALMLVAYIWAVFGLYSIMGAVFTLSAIGALVLGVGMTVDVNIINFERIRQELFSGRSVRNAVNEGQQLSLSAIFDAQFTTLIAALIMYIWGNGTVKGFATMLIITVVMTLVLNVGMSKILMTLVVDSGICDDKPEWFGVKKSQIPDVTKGESQFYSDAKDFDFMGKAKYIIRAALTIFAVALLFGVINGATGKGFMNIGIDFSAGTQLTVTSKDTTVSIDDVKAEMEKLGYNEFSYQSSGEYTVYATGKVSLDSDQLKEVKSEFNAIYGEEPGDNIVTPVVGKDLVKNAFILTIVAWIAMMAYVTFRYEWDYAVGCLTALIHDCLMVLAAFCIMRMEVNITLISVLLTIIGYSINNSIIIFDRIRENMGTMNGKKMTSDDYKSLVNTSIKETIWMALDGSITTIIPVIFLLIMGSTAILTFNVAMFIGLIAGTFSSIFIAPRVWVWFRVHHTPKEKVKKAKKEKKENLDEYTIKGINA